MEDRKQLIGQILLDISCICMTIFIVFGVIRMARIDSGEEIADALRKLADVIPLEEEEEDLNSYSQRRRIKQLLKDKELLERYEQYELEKNKEASAE